MENLGCKALRGRLVGALTYCRSLRCSIVDMKPRENARSLSTMLCHITTLVENMIDAENPWVGPSKRKSVIGSFLGPR